MIGLIDLLRIRTNYSHTTPVAQLTKMTFILSKLGAIEMLRHDMMIDIMTLPSRFVLRLVLHAQQPLDAYCRQDLAEVLKILDENSAVCNEFDEEFRWYDENGDLLAIMVFGDRSNQKVVDELVTGLAQEPAL